MLSVLSEVLRDVRGGQWIRLDHVTEDLLAGSVCIMTPESPRLDPVPITVAK